MVELTVLPHETKHLIVIGTSLRKPVNILAAYLRSLAWQLLPRNVQPIYLFVDDGLDADAKTLVEDWLKERSGQLVPSGQAPVGDFSDVHPETHQWSQPAMQRVGANKDWILNAARANRAEAVWLCDADLICDPMTLTSLWSVPEQIVCAVYWTRWQKVPGEINPVHAGPQVWQSHPYGLAGNGMEEWELRRKLINRQIVHVYGQGACTLIRREAMARGVSFAPWPANTGLGLMQGEDRHFCIRAEALHLKMVADGWPDIFHIYHRPEDEALISEKTRDLLGLQRDSTGPTSPFLGDLVSLELNAMEPVPTQQGWVNAPIQYVRGRIGRLTIHPEIEDAVTSMQRSDVRIIPVHFGLDYPFAPYRGQRRLIRVTLIDHKPMGFAPVIDQEIVANTAGSWIDTTTMTPEGLDLMREVHA